MFRIPRISKGVIKMKRMLALAIFTIILPISLLAAGASGTWTKTEIGDDMIVLTLPWTSDSATGAVSATTDSTITAAIQGWWVIMGSTNPRARPNPPLDNYDIAVKDEDGVDIFGAKLENRDTLYSEQALPYIGGAYGPRPIIGSLTAYITNAGNSKTGTLILILSR